MVRSSIQPRSRSRSTKAVIHGLMLEGSVVPRKAIMGSFPGCCARAASGQATAAPPRSDMNSRRFIRSPRRRALGGGRASAVPRGCRANNFPEAAIMESFREVEGTLWEMVPFLGLPTKGRAPPCVIEELQRKRYIDENTANLFHKLREARNVAA